VRRISNWGWRPLTSNSTIVYGSQGPNFPVRWDPRYTIAAGFAANPDHREGYAVNKTGPREPAAELEEDSDDYYVNPADQPDGALQHSRLVRIADAF
jgi:hypothetical protein